MTLQFMNAACLFEMLALVINFDFSLSTNRLTNTETVWLLYTIRECQSVYAFLLLMRKVTSSWHPTVSLNPLYPIMWGLAGRFPLCFCSSLCIKRFFVHSKFEHVLINTRSGVKKMFGTTKHSDMTLLTGQDGLIRGKRGTDNRYATIKYFVIFTFLMQSHLKCSGLRSSSECRLSDDCLPHNAECKWTDSYTAPFYSKKSELLYTTFTFF